MDLSKKINHLFLWSFIGQKDNQPCLKDWRRSRNFFIGQTPEDNSVGAQSLLTKANELETTQSATDGIDANVSSFSKGKEVASDTVESKSDSNFAQQAKANASRLIIESKLHVYLTEVHAKMGAVVVKVDAVEGKVDAVVDRMDAVEGKVDAVKRNVNEGKRKMDAVEGKVDAVEGKVDAVEGEVDAVEGKVNTVEGNVDAVSGKVDNIQAEMKEVKDMMSKLFGMTVVYFSEE